MHHTQVKFCFSFPDLVSVVVLRQVSPFCSEGEFQGRNLISTLALVKFVSALAVTNAPL